MPNFQVANVHQASEWYVLQAICSLLGNVVLIGQCKLQIFQYTNFYDEIGATEKKNCNNSRAETNSRFVKINLYKLMSYRVVQFHCVKEHAPLLI